MEVSLNQDHKSKEGRRKTAWLDTKRQPVPRPHRQDMRQAQEAGVRNRWGMFDNFECASELQNVNYTTLARVPKASLFTFVYVFKHHSL